MIIIAASEVATIKFISDGIDQIKIHIVCAFLITSLSHFALPILIDIVARDVFEKTLGDINNLEDTKNYFVLERGIQVSEQLYLNFITAKLQIYYRSTQAFLIGMVILSIKPENLWVLLGISIFFIFSNFILRKKILNNITELISQKFDLISKIRGSTDNYAKGLYFNKRSQDNKLVNNAYLQYFRLLAYQNSISGSIRSSFDVLSAALVVYIMTTNTFSMAEILAYGWAGLRLIPAVQQALFYYNIKKTSNKILHDTRTLNRRYQKYKSISFFENKKIQIVGASGTGKSSFLDSFATIIHPKQKIGYYAQNYVPLAISENEISKIKQYSWVPNVSDGLLSYGTNQYSAGELQRISIALILQDKTNEILIFDEPFSSQSIDFIELIQKTIIDDKRRCIIVSHLGILPGFKCIEIMDLLK